MTPGEEPDGRLEYSMSFTPSSKYTEDEIRSHFVTMGKYPTRLIICPGEPFQDGQKRLSAAMQVWCSDNMEDEWTTLDVQWVLELLNIDCAQSIVVRGVSTFSHTHDDWIPDETLQLGYKDYNGLKSAGWILNNKLRFRLTMKGSSLWSSKRKRQASDHGERMWRNMKYTDMVLCADEGGTEINCHRAFLANSSPVFERMLEDGMKEGETRRCVIRNASKETLEVLLEYVYTDTISEGNMYKQHILMELLALADQYDVKGLAEKCGSNLEEIMTAENVHAVLQHLGRFERGECFERAKTKAREDETLFDGLVRSCVESPVGHNNHQ